MLTVLFGMGKRWTRSRRGLLEVIRDGAVLTLSPMGSKAAMDIIVAHGQWAGQGLVWHDGDEAFTGHTHLLKVDTIKSPHDVGYWLFNRGKKVGYLTTLAESAVSERKHSGDGGSAGWTRATTGYTI